MLPPLGGVSNAPSRVCASCGCSLSFDVADPTAAAASLLLVCVLVQWKWGTWVSTAVNGGRERGGAKRRNTGEAAASKLNQRPLLVVVSNSET